MIEITHETKADTMMGMVNLHLPSFIRHPSWIILFIYALLTSSLPSHSTYFEASPDTTSFHS